MSGTRGAPDLTATTGDDDHTGTPTRRREDAPLLRGQATFTDDREWPRCAHLRFVRSAHGHASLNEVETSRATELDGVLSVYTWADIAASDSPGVLPLRDGATDHDLPGHPLLARDRLRYHGQPIAAVVGEDSYLARDGVGAVAVSADPLPAVVDPIRAQDTDSPAVYDNLEDNVVRTAELGDATATDDAIRAAEHVTSLSPRNNRLIPSALEPRAATAEYDPVADRLAVEVTSQSVHGHRRKLSHTLGIPESKLTVRAPSVGGGFGHKGHHHPGEAMAAWCARELERPVSWTATRRGNYLEGAHGRDHRTEAELGVDTDGTLRGLRVDTTANMGAYGLGGSPGMAARYGRLLSSQYAIEAIHCTARAVATNTAPVHSYRGAGRPEAIYVTERILDVAARELDLDPVTIRRRNLISADAFPYETPVGATYDSGAYETALTRARDAIGYDERRANGPERADGRRRGIGIACYTESTGGGHESAVVQVQRDGTVTVAVGTHSHGQGHATTYAQLVSDVLELPPTVIEVSEGDTAETPAGTGTFGSRSAVVGGNAVVTSAQAVLAKARRLAAAEFEVDLGAVDYADGTFRSGGESLPFAAVADLAHSWGLPDGFEPGLEGSTFYSPEGTAYTFGTHAAEVAIDPDTGRLEIIRYVAVDDCGERLNPLIVEGQIHGGIAQGIGQARAERAVYDSDGILQTDTMQDYALPRATQLPSIDTDATVTPSPLNELGVKGIGEAGTIAAPPTIVNAVVDALAGLDVRHIDMPVTDEAIWEAITAASR